MYRNDENIFNLQLSYWKINQTNLYLLLNTRKLNKLPIKLRLSLHKNPGDDREVLYNTFQYVLNVRFGVVTF